MKPGVTGNSRLTGVPGHRSRRIAPVEYNYRNLAELGPEWQGWSGEMFGVSALLSHGDRVFHTYSSYARSDGPALGWLRHHAGMA